MQFSLPPLPFTISLKSKYLPSKLYSRNISTCVLPPQYDGPDCVFMKNRGPILLVFCNSNCKFYIQELVTQQILPSITAAIPHIFSALHFSCITFWIMIFIQDFNLATFSNIYYHSLLRFCTASCWRHTNIRYKIRYRTNFLVVNNKVYWFLKYSETCLKRNQKTKETCV